MTHPCALCVNDTKGTNVSSIVVGCVDADLKVTGGVLKKKSVYEIYEKYQTTNENIKRASNF